jgi:cyanophycin synthetase
VHHLQLSEPARAAGTDGVTSSGKAGRLWLRTRRRLTDVRGILERRRFRALRGRFYDTLWREAASSAGADVTRLANGLLQIRRGSLATFVDQSDVMLDSAITARLLLDKAITYQWLAAKGLRTPRSIAFDLDTIHLAEGFMARQPGPVVIKPADGTGCGHGVTTHVSTHDALRNAALHAAAFHARLLAEEQLAGSSYRLLFLDGDFIDAVRRDPPVLTGDGHSSIRQLAQRENDRRREGEVITALSPLIVDRECSNTLARRGLDPGSVPRSGEQVQVKLAVNENAARENHVVREEVHPEILETCRRIALDFGLGFAGFDVIAEDISRPPEQGGTVFTEINIAPGIHHHYLVAEPDRRAEVAQILLDRMFTRKRGVFAL